MLDWLFGPVPFKMPAGLAKRIKGERVVKRDRDTTRTYVYTDENGGGLFIEYADVQALVEAARSVVDECENDTPPSLGAIERLSAALDGLR